MLQSSHILSNMRTNLQRKCWRKLCNKTVRKEGKDICVSSGDVVGLYPSLKHKHSVKLCGDLIMNCPADFRNIDYQTASIFLITNCTESELSAAGLAGVVPARRYAKGAHPKSATPELLSRTKDKSSNQVPSKFLPICNNLRDYQKRRLLAKVVEVGVRKVVKNHVYLWRGCYWLQRLGVPTDLMLSGIIGRVTMDHWRGLMEKLLLENQMVSYLNEKYVDDVEVICENLEVGSRWSEAGLTVTEEAAAEDRQAGRAKDQVTMGVWRDMASSLVPGLKFTTDCCSDNVSGTVPMLDFQLWVEKEADPDNPGPDTSVTNVQML